MEPERPNGGCCAVCMAPIPACVFVGAPVILDDLDLATVGNGVFIAPSSITFSDGTSIGLGLFADRDFRPGQPITEYYGYRFRDADVPDDKLEHAIEGVGGWVIDGTRSVAGNRLTPDTASKLAALDAGGGAYANDLDYPRVTGMAAAVEAPKVVNPPGAVQNAAFRRIMDQQTKTRADLGEPVGSAEFAIYLEATRDIARGDEIFVSYNLMAYVSTAKRRVDEEPKTGSARRKQSTPRRRPVVN